MLLCTHDEDPISDENDSPKKKDKDKKYQYIHGSKFIYCITYRLLHALFHIIMLSSPGLVSVEG